MRSWAGGCSRKKGGLMAFFSPRHMVDLKKLRKLGLRTPHLIHSTKTGKMSFTSISCPSWSGIGPLPGSPLPLSFSPHQRHFSPPSHYVITPLRTITNGARNARAIPGLPLVQGVLDHKPATAPARLPPDGPLTTIPHEGVHLSDICYSWGGAQTAGV